MTRQPFTQVAAERKVLEQEGVCFVKLFQVAYILWLSLFAHHYLEVHDAAILGLAHLQRPHTVAVVILLLLLVATVAFAHLKREGLTNEVKEASASTLALLTLKLLASLCSLLNCVHILQILLGRSHPTTVVLALAIILSLALQEL